MEDTPDTGQFTTWGKTAQDFITQNGPQFKTEACILSSVKQIASPGWMHETSAQGWCTGMGGMGWGRKWDGDSGWGTHVNPWLTHVHVWQKPLQYCKVISLQLIKIIGEKNCFFL